MQEQLPFLAYHLERIAISFTEVEPKNVSRKVMQESRMSDGGRGLARRSSFLSVAAMPASTLPFPPPPLKQLESNIDWLQEKRRL